MFLDKLSQNYFSETLYQVLNWINQQRDGGITLPNTSNIVYYLLLIDFKPP